MYKAMILYHDLELLVHSIITWGSEKCDTVNEIHTSLPLIQFDNPSKFKFHRIKVFNNEHPIQLWIYIILLFYSLD